MQYLLTLYGNQGTWGDQPEPEHSDEMSRFGRFGREAAAAAEIRPVLNAANHSLPTTA